MELTLTNFSQVIDPTILDRGRRYYDDGHVLELRDVDNGHWQALVEGDETYYVEITITKVGAIDWGCDCPYDWGPVCKHVAAVLYAVEEMTATSPPKKIKPRKKRKTRADKLRDALDNLARDELYDLLLELALNDRELAHLILARYGPATGGKKEYHRLVKDALRLGKGQHGFIDYWGATRAAKGVYELLFRADAYLTNGQPAQAIAIYKAVIESVVPEMGHVDDSTGELSDCIHVALEGLYKAAGQLAPGSRTKLFDYCLAEAIKEPYADWDWRWDLAGIAAELVDTPRQQVTLFATLDQIAARREGEGRLAGYDRERAELIKLVAIQRHDDDAAVQAFLEEHIQDEQMRLELARFHLEQGDSAAARQVCEAWLNLSSPQKPGLRPDFLVILLEVAEVAGDHLEQIKLTETLFLDTGHLEFYERLKELVGPAEWLAYRPGFLQRVQQQGRLWLVDLGDIYINEEMWPELLAYVQANPHAVDHHYEHLARRFPRELSIVYEELALVTLERKINRKGYRKACTYLRRMQELGQGERVAALVTQWRTEYKHRPALQDELNKAFGH